MQAEAAECGIACLAMIANFHGFQASLGFLRAQLGGSSRGVTLAQMIRMAGSLDLSARALRLEPAGLKSLAVPCILHWNLDHFVVLERVSRGFVEIIDPAIGRARVSMETVNKCFSGVALELVPGEGFRPRRTRSELSLSQFFGAAASVWPALGKLLMLSLALQVFTLIAPFYTQLVVDQVIAAGDLGLLTVLVVAFGLLASVSIAISGLRSVLVLYFGAKLQYGWASRLFHHLVRLPLEFFERRHVGDVLSRFRSLGAIQGLVTTTVVEAVIDGLMAVTTICVMLFYSPTLTIVPVLALALYMLVRLALLRPQRELAHEALMQSAKENSHFLETLRGMLAIKSFAREVTRESTWQNRAVDSIRTQFRVSVLGLSQGIVNQLLFALENVLVIYLGARAVIDEHLSLGMLVAFLAYKVQFTGRASALLDKLLEFRLATVHLDRLSDIVLAEREFNVDSAQAAVIPPIQGRLEARGVSFRYSSSEPYVLQDVNLCIEPGECVAIVGPSGSGKTTLLKILMGLLAPTDGRILVDDYEMMADAVRLGYRGQIAAVMQEDCLLSGTLAENICFFDSSPDQRRIEASAVAAAIHDDIVKLPMGYHTLVGDMGSALSGGQKQRVILARAIYSQPRILFLDEATAHVDSETEERIHLVLARSNITRVVVAHRKETISIADRVLELDSSSLRVAAR